jgi:hypothetical protein
MSESDANGLEILESWVGATSRSQFRSAIFTATLKQPSLKDVYGWLLKPSICGCYTEAIYSIRLNPGYLVGLERRDLFDQGRSIWSFMMTT